MVVVLPSIPRKRSQHQLWDQTPCVSRATSSMESFTSASSSTLINSVDVN
jgi:hypothetical protein